ncbi:MAG: UDP-N-acetylmuramate dehydrogenase [Acidimicrobiales bacterium]
MTAHVAGRDDPSGSEHMAGLRRALGTRARSDHPLGSLTTYRVGGTAALFVEVKDESELIEVSRLVAGADVPILVLGRGSNLLVADAGFEGLVITLGAGFDTVTMGHDDVRTGGAASLPVVARRTAASGLRGFEWAVGVPGSIGGAVRMNAGGHGSDTASTLSSCRIVDLADGTVREEPGTGLRFGYRSSAVAPTEVVVEAVHRLEPGDAAEARKVIDEVVQWRRIHQPGGSNAGSVFTNPPGDSAGRLIDACGLRGTRLGSAEVSTKHANFIRADPGGFADDVIALIDHVRSVVADTTGVELQLEVVLVGLAGAASGSGAGATPGEASGSVERR